MTVCIAIRCDHWECLGVGKAEARAPVTNAVGAPVTILPLPKSKSSTNHFITGHQSQCLLSEVSAIYQHSEICGLGSIDHDELLCNLLYTIALNEGISME